MTAVAVFPWGGTGKEPKAKGRLAWGHPHHLVEQAPAQPHPTPWWWWWWWCVSSWGLPGRDPLHSGDTLSAHCCPWREGARAGQGKVGEGCAPKSCSLLTGEEGHATLKLASGILLALVFIRLWKAACQEARAGGTWIWWALSLLLSPT